MAMEWYVKEQEVRDAKDGRINAKTGETNASRGRTEASKGRTDGGGAEDGQAVDEAGIL